MSIFLVVFSHCCCLVFCFPFLLLQPQVVMLLNILVAAVGVPLMRILCLMFYFVSMCCAISIAFAERLDNQTMPRDSRQYLPARERGPQVADGGPAVALDSNSSGAGTSRINRPSFSPEITLGAPAEQ